jgi:hypothetical protein
MTPRMEDLQFPDEFCRFLQSTVPSVEAAEALLMLRQQSDRWWSAGEAAAALPPGTRVTEADWARFMELWQARGLVVLGAHRHAQFHPDTPELAAHADRLAHVYSERPVTLFRIIYALQDARVRSFADAFRLRKA